MSRKIKFLVWMCVVLIIIACYVMFLTSYNHDGAATATSYGRLEFVTGENVYQDDSGKLQMDIDSFSQVGETKCFSMTLHNASSYTAYPTITIDIPNEYFTVVVDENVKIASGETKTISFSITLIQHPSTDTSFSIEMSIHTEYCP